MCWESRTAGRFRWCDWHASLRSCVTGRHACARPSRSRGSVGFAIHSTRRIGDPGLRSSWRAASFIVSESANSIYRVDKIGNTLNAQCICAKVESVLVRTTRFRVDRTRDSSTASGCRCTPPCAIPMCQTCERKVDTCLTRPRQDLPPVCNGLSLILAKRQRIASRSEVWIALSSSPPMSHANPCLD